jgi:hypothetical protein
MRQLDAAGWRTNARRRPIELLSLRATYAFYFLGPFLIPYQAPGDEPAVELKEGGRAMVTGYVRVRCGSAPFTRRRTRRCWRSFDDEPGIRARPSSGARPVRSWPRIRCSSRRRGIACRWTSCCSTTAPSGSTRLPADGAPPASMLSSKRPDAPWLAILALVAGWRFAWRRFPCPARTTSAHGRPGSTSRPPKGRLAAPRQDRQDG